MSKLATKPIIAFYQSLGCPVKGNFTNEKTFLAFAEKFDYELGIESSCRRFGDTTRIELFGSGEKLLKTFLFPNSVVFNGLDWDWNKIYQFLLTWLSLTHLGKKPSRRAKRLEESFVRSLPKESPEELSQERLNPLDRKKRIHQLYMRMRYLKERNRLAEYEEVKTQYEELKSTNK